MLHVFWGENRKSQLDKKEGSQGEEKALRLGWKGLFLGVGGFVNVPVGWQLGLWPQAEVSLSFLSGCGPWVTECGGGRARKHLKWGPHDISW